MGGFCYEVSGFVLAFLIDGLDGPGHAEGFGVEGGLGDQAVGEGKAEDASDPGGESEEEEVPVEAGRLLQRKFGALSNQGRDCGGCTLIESCFCLEKRIANPPPREPGEWKK